jgi:hypothetical protein
MEGETITRAQMEIEGAVSSEASSEIRIVLDSQ